MDQLTADLAVVLEKHAKHRAAMMPAWMLARMLTVCLDTFIHHTCERDRWKACRERDPQWPPSQDLNWPPPPFPPEPQG